MQQRQEEHRAWGRQTIVQAIRSTDAAGGVSNCVFRVLTESVRSAGAAMPTASVWLTLGMTGSVLVAALVTSSSDGQPGRRYPVLQEVQRELKSSGEAYHQRMRPTFWIQFRPSSF